MDSIIGDAAEAVIQRFLTGMPHRLSVGTGKLTFNAILLGVDEDSGRAINIERICRQVEE
jgi:hypothetical protein